MGLLAMSFGPWTVAAGLLGIAVARATGKIPHLKHTPDDTGITTEVAILLMLAM